MKQHTSKYDRITPIGKFLRKTSLDEMPQFINVLKGEMSIVGPRPLRKEYLSAYNPRQAKRHTVRPGITGWAQINGRNQTTWEERLEQDVWYVENLRFKTDVLILLRTIAKVLKREGVDTNSSTTFSPFKGIDLHD